MCVCVCEYVCMYVCECVCVCVCVCVCECVSHMTTDKREIKNGIAEASIPSYLLQFHFFPVIIVPVQGGLFCFPATNRYFFPPNIYLYFVIPLFFFVSISSYPFLSFGFIFYLSCLLSLFLPLSYVSLNTDSHLLS